jgi:hypothetical protein
MLKLILLTIAFMTASCSDASSNCSKEDTLKLISAGYTKSEINDICGQTEQQNRSQLTDKKSFTYEGLEQFEAEAGSEITYKKSSAVEGNLVDRNGVPVADVKIIAAQVQHIKGYGQFETVTQSDGSFRIEGLFPSSHYVLKPWSKKWRSETALPVESAPQGETAVLPSPMVISRAYAKSGGSVVHDLATGTTRFSVSDDGVISDSQTSLDWLVGPDRDTDYKSAEQWVASISDVAGGNWRMPMRQELKSLYQKGAGERNLDPAFKTTGWHVWAEPNTSSSAWRISFSRGSEHESHRENSLNYRVFGVRARPR